MTTANKLYTFYSKTMVMGSKPIFAFYILLWNSEYIFLTNRRLSGLPGVFPRVGGHIIAQVNQCTL